MVKQTVEIFARIRPPKEGASVAVRCVGVEEVGGSPAHAHAHGPAHASSGGSSMVEFAHSGGRTGAHTLSASGAPTSLRFSFNRVFDASSSQEDVYTAMVAPLVSRFTAGVNVTVMAFGQTGSGKTYSCSGGGKYKNRGIIPRAIADVFAATERLVADGVDARLHASYLEIYNENVYDLLNTEQTGTSPEAWERVTVREDRGGALHLTNLRVYEVRTEKDCLNLLFLGNVQRSVCETAHNHASSRSHAIFTLTLATRTTDAAGVPLTRTSKFHLVDLAGSERIHKSAPTGADGASTPGGPQHTLRREGRYINLSLHHLEQVILALQQQQQVAARYARLLAARAAALKDGSSDRESVGQHSDAHAQQRSMDALGLEASRGSHSRSRSAPRGMFVPERGGPRSVVGQRTNGIASAVRSRSRSRSASRDAADPSHSRRTSVTSYTGMSDVAPGSGSFVAEGESSFFASRPETPSGSASGFGQHARGVGSSRRRTPAGRPPSSAVSVSSGVSRGRQLFDAASVADPSSAQPSLLMPPPPVAVHVPYRNSMLTSILRDSLGGNCHTVLLATLNPEFEYIEESVSTCRFASRCGALASEVVVNESRDATAAANALTKENTALRAALSEERSLREAMARELEALRGRASAPGDGSRLGSYGALLPLSTPTRVGNADAVRPPGPVASVSELAPLYPPSIVSPLTHDETAALEERVAECIRFSLDFEASNLAQLHTLAVPAAVTTPVLRVLVQHLHPDLLSLLLRHAVAGESATPASASSTSTPAVSPSEPSPALTHITVPPPADVRLALPSVLAHALWPGAGPAPASMDDLPRACRSLSLVYCVCVCVRVRVSDASALLAVCACLLEALAAGIEDAARGAAARENTREGSG